jgi:flagellar basal-body rod protein FlgB
LTKITGNGKRIKILGLISGGWMNEIYRTNNIPAPGSLPVAPSDSRSSLRSISDPQTVPAFSASYALALNKVSGLSSPTGQASVLPAINPNSMPTTVASTGLIASLNGSRHIPLTGLQQGTASDNIHERALGLRAYRQEILASNIANADTPGYKAVDIDIPAALRNGQSVGSHIPLKYHVPSQGSVDGNTVEMDVERAKFAENALMYEYEVDRVRGEYKDMEELFKNLPY